MVKPKVGVVGAGGVVGKTMCGLFGEDAVPYDLQPGYPQEKEAINDCDIAFVCVPTPMCEADRACDTSVVEGVVSWLETPLIVIRSTIEPGTVDRLGKAYDKRIVFQPEYTGETVAHVFKNEADFPFIVLGGAPEDTSAVADFYKRYYNAMVRFYFCDAVTAEIAKYMENAFYAVKVTFVNEFYDIAKAHGADFNRLREIWLADTRISRDHTFVYPEARGFDGKCLPKDVNAIVQSARKQGYDAEFLRSTLEINERFLARNRQAAPSLSRSISPRTEDEQESRQAKRRTA